MTFYYNNLNIFYNNLIISKFNFYKNKIIFKNIFFNIWIDISFLFSY